jgi:glutamate carboxypeptidase
MAELDAVVLLNAAEEEMTPCFGKLLRRELKGAAACLVFETGKYDPVDKEWTLVRARKGRAVWKIRAEGVQAHAGNSHHLGENAIVKLAQAVIGIEAKTCYRENLTYNVGQIQGGDVANAVPGGASALVEMRCDDQERFDTAQVF